jgi:hypothetical protein
MSGTEQTVVADFDEARPQHVLKEAADELLSRDRTTLNLISGRLFVSEGEDTIFQFKLRFLDVEKVSAS